MKRRKIFHLIGVFFIIAFLGASMNFIYSSSSDGSLGILPLRVDPEEHERDRTEAMEQFVREGRRELNRGNHGDAIILFQKALRIDPDHREVQQLMDEAIAGYLDEELVEPEDIPEIEPAEPIVPDVEPEDPVIAEPAEPVVPEEDVPDQDVLDAIAKARQYSEDGEFNEALELYESVFDKVDDETRNILEQEMREVRDAIEREENILRLQEEARQHEQEGNYNQVLNIYQELHLLDPDQSWDAKADEMAAIIEEKEEMEEEFNQLIDAAQDYEDQGKWQEALDNYILAQQLFPERDEVREGIVRSRENIEKRALEQHLEQAIADAESALNNKEYEKALEKIQVALEIDPDNEQALDLQEQIYHRQEVSQLLADGYAALDDSDIDRAKNIAKDLTAVDPQNGQVKQYLLDIREKEEQLERDVHREEFEMLLAEAREAYEEGLFDEARDFAVRASAIDPDDSELINLLDKMEKAEDEARIADLKKQVIIFERAGDYEQALQKSEEILEIDPEEPEAKAWVIVFQRKIEELEEEKRKIAQRVLEENIRELMQDAKYAYEEGDLETARQKWGNVLSMKPTHEEAEAFLRNTEEEYEEYLIKIGEKEREREREEIAREKLYTPITISFTDIKIADFLNQISLLSDIDFVIPHGGEARVSGRFSETPLLDVLNAVLIPNGFVYTVDGPLVKVSLNLISRVFQLSDYETAQMQNLEDKNIISEILYGPDREPTIPGQRYVLDGRRNMMVLTDTALNIQKIESLLQNLPDDIVPELLTRMYSVRRNVGPKVKMLLEALLEAESTTTERQIPGRQILFESSTDTLIVRDTQRNIEMAENFLMDREFIEKVEKDELTIQSFPVVDQKLLETDPEQARELARKTTELVKTLLYHRIGETRARQEGRQIWLNEDYGTLTILDTKSNIDKVAEFLVTQPWRGEEEITEIIYVDYVDPSELHAKLEEILGVMDARDPFAVGPDRLVRRLRPGQSFRFRDADIECIRIRDIGPTTERRSREDRDFDGEVTLLVSTPTEIARTVTIREREGVQQIGDYVFRVPDANPAGRGWADVEVQYLPRDVRAEPDMMPVEVEQPPITITPDAKSSALIIRAKDPAMLSKVKFWIQQLDIPIPQVTIETRYVTVAEQAMKTLESSLSIGRFGGGFSLDDARAGLAFGGSSVNPVAPLIGGGGAAASPALAGFQPAGTTFDLTTSDGNVRWMLNLMEARGIAQVVTGPQLTILNNETGTFEITRLFSVIQRLSYTDVTYEDRDISEMLFTITPQVTRSKVINMDIQIDMTEYVPGSPELDSRGRRDQDAMFDVSQLTISPTRDEEKIRSIDTRVQLHDGETIVLGGFKSEYTQDTVSRIPILGDIPLIGRVLFGRQHQVQNKDNLLIFLTAYLR